MSAVTMPMQSASKSIARGVAAAPSLPFAVLRRARDEAVSIWDDARRVAGHDVSSTAAPAQDGMSPDQVYFAWYGGLAAMAALRVIEWRLAALIAAAHTVERYGHRQRVKEFVAGLDAGI